MTREDIVRMARSAGVLSGYESELFQRFAAPVIAAEREACAQLCDENERANLYGVKECADAIRSRGKE